MAFRVHNPARGRTVGLCVEKAWMVVVACDNGHGHTFGAEELGQRFPAAATLDDLAARFRCKVCGSTEGGLDIRQDHAVTGARDYARTLARQRGERD